MSSPDLSTREGDGRVVVVLRGELDVMDTASAAARLCVVAAGGKRTAASGTCLNGVPGWVSG